MKAKNTFINSLNLYNGKKWTIIGLSIILTSAGLLVHRALFGIAIPDESFYLTVPYRILMGDAFFINEWHAAQLAGVLQFLPVLFFVKVFGSGEGIILFFRLLYVVCHTIVSCFVFKRISRYGFFPALVAALMFELYTPETLVFPNYYTMSLVPLTVVTLVLVFEKKPTVFKDALCGILFACVVLAEPMLSWLYFVYVAVVVAFSISRRKTPTLFLPKRFFRITAGVVMTAILFFVLLLSRASLLETLSAIKNIFQSNEYSLKTMFLYDRLFKMLYHIGSFVIIALPICVVAIMADRNRSKRKLLWFSMSTLLSVLLIALFINSCFKKNDDYPMIAMLHVPLIIAFMGISTYLLTEKKDKKLLVVWLVGLLYIILVGFNSKAMYASGTYGFVLSNIASVPMIVSFLREIFSISDGNKEQSDKTICCRKKLAVAGITAVLVGVVGLISISMSIYILSVKDPCAGIFMREELTDPVAIDRGGLKGIRATKGQKAVYDAILDDIAYIEEHSEGKYTVLSDDSWYLFSSDRSPLAFTLWYRLGLGDVYMQYYDYVGEFPSYIYIVNKPFFWCSTMEDYAEHYYLSEALDYVTTHFNCAITEGKAGYIIKVDS